MPHRIILLLMTMSLLATLPAQAQQNLTYGEAITGEITDDVPEQVYTFFGKANEVVAVSMDAVDILPTWIA